MASELSGGERRNRPGLAGGLQVVAVLATLVLGAVLQTDARSRGPAAAELPPLPPPPGYRAEPAVPPSPTGADERLTTAARESPPIARDSAVDARGGIALRAIRDAERLEARGDGYTVQLALLCDTTRIEAHLATYADDEELYVLPADRDGRLCFRLCWGHYASADAARVAPGLPAALRAGDIFPKPVSAVLE